MGGFFAPWRALFLISGFLCNLVAQTPQVPSRFIKNLDAGKPQTWVVFGTSLSAGGAWVGLLDGYLKARYPGLTTLHNESGSGHSSQWALTALPNVTRHKAAVLFTEFAMNDSYFPPRDGFTEGVPVETSRANLNTIIDAALAANSAAEVFPQTMDLPLGIHRVRRPVVEQYYEGYRQVAAARKLVLADHMPVWQSILAFDTAFYLSWVPDSIHPNAEASGAITFPGVLSVLTGARVGITAPANQAVFSPGSTIGIQAQVTTPVTRVDFYQGKTKIGSDSAAPYAFDWKNVPAGKYLIMAKLMQGAYAVAVSQGVLVRVANVSAARPRPAWARLGQDKRAPGYLPDGRRRTSLRVGVPEFTKPACAGPEDP